MHTYDVICVYIYAYAWCMHIYLYMYIYIWEWYAEILYMYVTFHFTCACLSIFVAHVKQKWCDIQSPRPQPCWSLLPPGCVVELRPPGYMQSLPSHQKFLGMAWAIQFEVISYTMTRSSQTTNDAVITSYNLGWDDRSELSDPSNHHLSIQLAPFCLQNQAGSPGLPNWTWACQLIQFRLLDSNPNGDQMPSKEKRVTWISGDSFPIRMINEMQTRQTTKYST